MTRRLTPLQRHFDVPRDFVDLARQWAPDAIDTMLSCVWKGFDQLKVESFQLERDDQNVEDDITFYAYLRIHELIDDRAPYTFVHKPPENERRTGAMGSSPTPDSGFVFKANPRAILPVEAKLLRTDGAVSAYVTEIHDNFLSGRYAFFSSEGAMLGYLLSGLPSKVFGSISRQMRCALKEHSVFSDRNHRISEHARDAGGRTRQPFRCHHMIIDFSHHP
ncbi:MAG: hypothetical protein JW741_26255 [Sedimentisphaerales bacterium]|nr:hypothetical protein [Sedimentisphaerales bacterium]